MTAIEGLTSLLVETSSFFPKRVLETISYNIEDTYQGLYLQLRGRIGKPRRSGSTSASTGELTYARYGLWKLRS